MNTRPVSDRSETPSASRPIDMTADGIERLQADLRELSMVRRPALIRQIQRATLFLDNAAGTSVATVARHDLDILDQQIASIEAVLKDAKVIEPPADFSTVKPGSQVTVRYDDGTEETLTLVGSSEADPSQGYVSMDSPAGRALLGKRAGSDVSVGSGDDALTMSVVSIEKPDPKIDTPREVGVV